MNQQPPRLENRVALITGGGSGIGAAVAALFAAHGAGVGIIGRTRATLEATAAAIGDQCAVLPGSVAVQENVDRIAAAALERWGRIDILVNGAGIFAIGEPLHEITDEKWQSCLDANLTGAFRMARAVIPVMLGQRSGVILNIASVSGVVAFPNGAAYGVSKAGLIQLTRNIAVDYAQSGIRCNCICPGGTDTPMTAPAMQNPDFARAMLSAHPAGRLAQPEEIAAAALYLVSDDAGFTTGAVLPVDGGLLASG